MDADPDHRRHKVAMASHLLLFRPNGSMLVVRRCGTSYLNGYWSVPAGHVEEGESAVHACKREVAEEVGISIDVEQLEFVLVQQKSGMDGEERVDFFFIHRWPYGNASPAIASSPDEISAIGWAKPSDLPTPFAPYVSAALEAIDEGRRFSIWGLE